MKQIIQKKDFESYEIILPFSAIAGKRRKQYLCSELEKMHPCFSDEFAFDSAVKKIGRKGLCADVVVMNKYRLAEYEDKRRLAGKGFRLELNPEKTGKTGKKALFLRRRFFIDKKWKLGFYFVLLSVAACLLVAFSGFYSGITAGKISREIKDLEAAAIGKASYPAKSDTAEVPVEAPFEYTFLDAVAKADGKIAWFEWNIEGFTQKLTASVTGLFPESFESGAVNSVVYENGIPEMKVSFSKVLKKKTEENIPATLLNNQEFSKTLRHALKTGEATLLEENASPYHIEFLYKSESEAEKLFENLAQIISVYDRSVTSISVRQTEADVLRIGFSIDAIPFNGFDLTLLSENLGLFLKATKTYTAENLKGKGSAGDSNALPAAVYQQKLGEIRLRDNSLVIFYKNPEGKIENKILKKGEEKS